MVRKSTEIKTINDVRGSITTNNFSIVGTTNEIDVATSAGAGNNPGQVQIGISSNFSGGGGGGTSASVMPVVYMDSGNVNIVNTGATTIPFDTEVLDPDGNATSPADGKIRLAAAGIYRVSYSLPINDDGSTLSDRTRVFAFMQTCANDAFSSNVTTVAQSRVQVYTREASGGSGLATSFLYEHTANDYLRIRIQSQNNTNISTETNQSQISIALVSGVGSKAPIIAATGATTLTNAQSGSVVYITGSGSVTLPASIEEGVQFVIINDTGGTETIGENGNTHVLGTHGTMAANTARTYVAVSNGNFAAIG